MRHDGISWSALQIELATQTETQHVTKSCSRPEYPKEDTVTPNSEVPGPLTRPKQSVNGLPSGSFRLDGLTAVVTGGSRNIGAAIAMAFAESGADVVIVGRRETALSLVASQIRAAHPEQRIWALPADVGNRGQVDRLVEALHEQVGFVDVLVNNAAVAGTSVDVLDISDTAWDEMYETNLLGPFRLARALAKPMIESGQGGSIINMLSGSGFQPAARLCPYGTMKAALWMMTRYLAEELAPLIRVNGIMPGVTAEDGEPQSPAAREVLRSSVPFGRAARPEEISGAAVYLASTAATYTSGSLIVCNGARAW